MEPDDWKVVAGTWSTTTSSTTETSADEDAGDACTCKQRLIVADHLVGDGTATILLGDLGGGVDQEECGAVLTVLAGADGLPAR
ncbi:hypothetical protein [Amycolatopsis alba]|uniref:Uncharacterized protein n=1 Tax=Amycolatopsis alba DSM 44262 TaxID=1125972 RepID=A0A229RSU4_AMYAL|nr:hypothetical protein [Amycolatopsis alba]OXM49743.1 hypothetical protein CFP75_18410 [Amycolatopsis alba DSM 44262]